MSIAIVSFTSFTINLLLGRWRAKYKKFTIAWWLLIHASIPILIPLRIWLDTPKIWIPLFIGIAIAGQFIGSRYLVNNIASDMDADNSESTQ
nr:hypothetical protein [uncultured Carboxylicivirga sp.]